MSAPDTNRPDARVVGDGKWLQAPNGRFAAKPGGRAMHKGRVDTSLKPSERSAYGATIITLYRAEDRSDTRTITGHGTAMEAVVDCVSEIDSWEGTWFIASISTPVSIMTDMSGARKRLDVSEGHQLLSAGQTVVPEVAYLMKLRPRRYDLLPPEARPSRDHAGKRRKAP